MTAGHRVSTPSAAAHLAALAREPRPAGGSAERLAREYAASELRNDGFEVHDETFEYSAFPGRYATTVGGVLAMATVHGAGSIALLSGTAWEGLVTLGVGVTIIVFFVRAMSADAVLDLRGFRERSTNLVATRGSDVPRVWLIAHLDSKSQPIPSAMRMAGVVLVASSFVTALCAGLLQLLSLPHRAGWMGAMGLAFLGGPTLISSVVRARSNGAVDNASGVATVLLAASQVRADLPVGVLLPSAEELGMAGARAWAREWRRRHEPGLALNCDGVDDQGEMTLMYSGTKPAALIDSLRVALTPPPRVRRMPLGLLTDSVALADHGWSAVTVCRGSLATLRRVHTRHDSLAALEGTGIEPAAALLVRAVEALA